MRGSLRQSMSWLHTWAGLLFGWVLYFMFVTGTVAYLDTEIDRWMKPEAPRARTDVPAEEVAQRGFAYLSRHAEGAQRWIVGLPIDRNDPYPRVFWDGRKVPGEPARGEALLNAQTGAALAARETGGGQALYRMHWRLHYLPDRTAEWIVGLATMFMLVALVSGVIVHKKIFADFFTFRRGKGQRAWLDAHNAASVLTLPYQLMITYSGLIFLMFTYMPLVIGAWYGPGEKNRQVFTDEVFVPASVVAPSGRPAPLVDVRQVLAQVPAHWGDAPVRSIEVRHAGDQHARIIVRGNFAAGPLRVADALVFDGVDGRLLSSTPANERGAKAFRDVMLGLHEALFAGPWLRVLFIVSGLLGCAMVATGLVLWTVKRRERVEKSRGDESFGLRIVERLNVATVIGLPVAMAVYFWANRLLPLDLAGRAAWEMHALFIAWAATFVHSACRPAARAWLEQCAVAALAYALLPLVNALTTQRGLAQSLPSGDWVMAGFDLGVLALGLSFSLLARHLHRRSQRRAVALSITPTASLAPVHVAGARE
jgi:uncharacterized iron-regulated membrane protein